MRVKLTALKDFETCNTWQEPIDISEGEILYGDLQKVDTGLEIIKLELYGVPTLFAKFVVQKFFEIEVIDQ